MPSSKKSTLKIESTSMRGDFKLCENGRKILELKYTNWHSGVAETIIYRDKFQLKPKSWWSGKIDILKNDKKVGEITHNSKLHLSIILEGKDGVEQTFVLKNSSKWKSEFEVTSASGKTVLILTPTNSWKKLNFDVQVLNKNIQVEELTVYSAYTCKLYYAYVSAS